jgi:membrane-associated phospholipid phosphatase
MTRFLIAGVCLFGSTIVHAQTLPVTVPLVPDAPDVADVRQTQNAAPAPARRSADAPFARLFPNLGGDLKEFANPSNLQWLAIGGGLAGLVHNNDRSLTTAASSSEDVREVLGSGRIIGGAMAQVGAAFGTYLVGRLVRSDEVAHLGSDLIRAQLLTQSVTQSIKLTARRVRPDGTMFSFPSGHTAGAFASATVLRDHHGWKVGLPAYGLAAYVGASRLSEERHYLSDVIFGATVGVLAAKSVTIGHGDRRFALAPYATPGGVGVNVVRIPVP